MHDKNLKLKDLIPILYGEPFIILEYNDITKEWKVAKVYDTDSYNAKDYIQESYGERYVNYVRWGSGIEPNDHWLYGRRTGFRIYLIPENEKESI